MGTLSHTDELVSARIEAGFARDLEVSAVRIPSPSFHEHDVADLFASAMRKIGLEVLMVEVPHPFRKNVATRQPVGVLKGTSAGPTLMLNGHMDHNQVEGKWDRHPFSGDFVDGFIHGRGAQDDKGGIVASIVAAKALIESEVQLAGDIWVCPVAGHKSGALGTKELLKTGWKPNYCINTENTGNGLATASVGVVECDIKVRGTPVHFGMRNEVKARTWNPIDQIAFVATSLGRSLTFLGENSWITFTPHPQLPEYPALILDEISSTRFMATVPEDSSTTSAVSAQMSSMPESLAYLEFQIRTVPGQSAETIRRDLERHLAKLQERYPLLDVVELNVPTSNPYYKGWDFPPFETPLNSRLVLAVASGHRDTFGVEPVVGGKPRLGAVGDGNFLAAAGVAVVQYGPGDPWSYDTEPAVNETIALKDIVNCAKTIALASIRLLGIKT
jgi:acetylornithine deacetylase